MFEIVRVLVIAANTERGNMITLPLGAGLIAAAARRAGHDARFLDLLNSADPAGDVTRAIVSFAPEAIGISVRNIDDQNRERPRFLLGQVKPIVDAWYTAFDVKEGDKNYVKPEDRVRIW